MCISTTHRHSIFCILPLHPLRSIAQNGAPQQRATALNTLSTDNTFRALRATAPQALAARRQARIGVEGQKQRTIYDTQQTQTLPGRVVRTEGSRRSKDVAVNEAYNGLGATFDFFWEVYARNSIDDEGMPLNATANRAYRRSRYPRPGCISAHPGQGF